MKRKLISLLLSLNLILLTACSASNISDGIAVMTGRKQVQTDNALQPYSTMQTEVDAGPHTLVFDEHFEAGGYYYNLLQDDSKVIYQSIYKSLAAQEESCELLNTTDSQVSLAYEFILFDHPELYYVDGFQLARYPDAVDVTFYPNYSKTLQERQMVDAQIESYKNAMFASINTDSEFNIVKGIYDYLVTNTFYDITAPDISNICSVVLHNHAVCDGYAKSMMYFCKAFGIESIVIPGYIRSTGTAHLWNAVKLNNQWYFVDVTWGDEDFNNEKKAPEVRYDYLCVSKEQIQGTHQIDSSVIAPQCLSTEMNYYYQTGSVITKADNASFKQIFSQFDEKKTIAFACSDATVYQQTVDYLISQKHIFDYTPSKKVHLGYITNNNVWSMTFWIKDE